MREERMSNTLKRKFLPLQGGGQEGDGNTGASRPMTPSPPRPSPLYSLGTWFTGVRRHGLQFKRLIGRAD